MIIIGIACMFISEQKITYINGNPVYYTDYPYRNLGTSTAYVCSLFLVLLILYDKLLSKQIRERAL
jgi:hypothetical protein